MDRLQALKEAVGKATGPDRSIDCWFSLLFSGDWQASAISDHAEWVRRMSQPYTTSYEDGSETSSLTCDSWDVKPYTASIDAALALVSKKLPGWWWLIRTAEPNGEVANPGGLETAFANIGPPDEVFKGEKGTPAWAATAPLAILAVLLDALSALEGHPLPEKTNG